jgi:hypothetical protein
MVQEILISKGSKTPWSKSQKLSPKKKPYYHKECTNER